MDLLRECGQDIIQVPSSRGPPVYFVTARPGVAAVVLGNY
jgi:hypothetical protein